VKLAPHAPVTPKGRRHRSIDSAEADSGRQGQAPANRHSVTRGFQRDLLLARMHLRSDKSDRRRYVGSGRDSPPAEACGKPVHDSEELCVTQATCRLKTPTSNLRLRSSPCGQRTLIIVHRFV